MTPTTDLPPEARSILEQLKSRIRSYVFWEGLALVVIVMFVFLLRTYSATKEVDSQFLRHASGRDVFTTACVRLALRSVPWR